MADERHCKECGHWRKLPPNPQDLRQVLGLCTESPPQLLTIPVPGGVQVQAHYPPLPPDFPACSRLALRPAAELILAPTENGN